MDEVINVASMEALGFTQHEKGKYTKNEVANLPDWEGAHVFIGEDEIIIRASREVNHGGRKSIEYLILFRGTVVSVEEFTDVLKEVKVLA